MSKRSIDDRFYDVRRGLKMRAAIAPKLAPFEGKPLTGGLYREFVTLLQRHMPSATPRMWLEESLEPFPSNKQIMTAESLDYEAWRILGNAHWCARYGVVPLPRWVGQEYDEWMPLQFISERPVPVKTSSGYRYGHEYRVRVLGGSLCASVLTVKWTSAQAGYVARQSGFAKFREGDLRMFHSGTLLVQLRIWALAQRVESESDMRFAQKTPRFTEYEANSAFRTHNVRIIRARTRSIDWTDFVCPNNYTHDCSVCAVGYAEGVDGCPVAVRPRTCEIKACTLCANDEALFEFGESSCIKCRNKAAFQVVYGKEKV